LAVDWDHPRNFIVVPPSSEPADVAELPFTPLAPSIGSQAWQVVVSDPSRLPENERAVQWIYHMPQGSDFPGDGRLIIEESLAAPLTPELLQQMVAENPYPGEYTALQIGDHPALLIKGGGVGRVILLHGDIRIDITGPRVTPQAVQKFADKFVQAHPAS
jgi:hypothetical protein